MMELRNFIYCLNAVHSQDENGNGESINAMGVLSAITPEYIPGAFSFSVIFSVLGVDTNVNNNICVSFYKDGDEIPLLSTNNLDIPPLPEKDDVELPPEYKGVNMTMDFRNIVFEKEGVYKTEVYFNGELLGSNPIYVKGKR